MWTTRDCVSHPLHVIVFLGHASFQFVVFLLFAVVRKVAAVALPRLELFEARQRTLQDSRLLPVVSLFLRAARIS